MKTVRDYGAIALVLLAVACGSPKPPAGPDSSTEPLRSLTYELVLNEMGVSETINFVVPPETRSITVVAEGPKEELLALGSLVVGAQELVGLDLRVSQGAAMKTSYFDLESGSMPGALSQSIRLGTFAHVFPYAPGLDLVAGEAQLRIVSTAAMGAVKLTILMPAEDGSNVLHLNLVRVQSAPQVGDDEAMVAELKTILSAGGIEIKIDEMVSIVDDTRSSITDFSEPQESPQSQSAQLAEWGQAQVSSSALNVYLVDSLPPFVGGLALGTPGPPVPGSYYFGVLARDAANPAELARVVAHELAHFLMLQHVENRDSAGAISPDPIDDTEAGQNNLMEQGTVITAGQSFALSRSSLLTSD